MEQIQEIVTGDRSIIPVDLTKNGAAFVVQPTATVTAMLVSTNGKTQFTSAITVEDSTDGSNWAGSRIAVLFERSATSGIQYQGAAQLEIQVTFNDFDDTWFVPVTIKRGQL